MVAAEDFGEDVGFFQPGAEALGDEEIVEAPADVPSAGGAEDAPPSVMSPALFKFAEGIEETSVYKGGEAVAFLDGEAVVANVGLGVGKVDLGVGDVEVAAKDDGLFLFQCFQVSQEITVPLLAVGEPGEIALGVGHINVDEVEIVGLGGQDAAFLVVLYNADVRGNGNGFFFNKNGGAGVTSFLGGIPEGFVVGRPELLDVFGCAFGFLKAEDVRALGIDEFEEIFLEHGAQAVDVPGNQFHERKNKPQMDTDETQILNNPPSLRRGRQRNEDAKSMNLEPQRHRGTEGKSEI